MLTKRRVLYASALCLLAAFWSITHQQLNAGLTTLAFALLQALTSSNRVLIRCYSKPWIYWLVSAGLIAHLLVWAPYENDIAALAGICVYSLGLGLPFPFVVALSMEVVGIQAYQLLCNEPTNQSIAFLSLLLLAFVPASQTEPDAVPLQKKVNRPCIRTSTFARMSMENTDLKLTPSWFDLGSGIVTIFNSQDDAAASAETKPQKARSLSQPLDSAVADLRSSSTSKAQWVIEAHRLQCVQAIGRGACGTVYRGSFDAWPVAIKQISTGHLMGMDQYAEYVTEVIHEASVLASLAHPQVLRFYGISIEERELLIVTELMHCSLNDVIGTAVLRRKSEDGSPIPTISAQSTGTKDAHTLVTTLLHQIASGMAYLHGMVSAW
jgi:hypothetical protein